VTMPNKLTLPSGTTIGSVLLVTYPWSKNIVPGTYDGKVVNIRDDRIAVHFIYKLSDDPPHETVTINLETGIDETWDAPVTDLQLAGPAAARPTV
jgi:hypothetical protein